MTFKAVTCPSCGGALQIPDDRLRVECAYCGADVLVNEDTQSAAARVNQAVKPAKAERPTSRFAKVLIWCGALALLSSIIIMAEYSDKTYGAFIMVVALVLIMTGVSNL